MNKRKYQALGDSAHIHPDELPLVPVKIVKNCDYTCLAGPLSVLPVNGVDSKAKVIMIEKTKKRNNL